MSDSAEPAQLTVGSVAQASRGLEGLHAWPLTCPFALTPMVPGLGTGGLVNLDVAYSVSLGLLLLFEGPRSVRRVSKASK